MELATINDPWTGHLRRTLQSYDEPLLRQVSTKLCKPRNHWPVAELIDRCLATLSNAAVLDRRLRDLEAPSRLALSLIASSRQNLWSVGNLVEMLVTLGVADGLGAIQALLDAGLLYPSLFPLNSEADNNQPRAGRARLKDFDYWLGQAAAPIVFAHPAVMERALGAPWPLPEQPNLAVDADGPAQEADGLEWLLRLAVIWQQVAAAPLRRTQQRDFFKRDLDRLRADPLLSTPPTDSLIDLADPGLFIVALALATGVLVETDGEIRAAGFPKDWNDGLAQAIATVWSALPLVESWNAARGWQVESGPGNPYPSVYLLAMLLLSQVPDDKWARPEKVQEWIRKRHPYWHTGRRDASVTGGNSDAGNRANGKTKTEVVNGADAGVVAFLLGVAFPMRLIQTAKDSAGERLVRLSPLGRWVTGLANDPGQYPAFAQTLLVQPNLEILAYRQGLTPALIASLTRVATWKGLGAACTLQLEPHSVYRALEAGETFASLVQILERHGMKELPMPVLDSLRTWSNKRDRISVYPAAALFEFPGPAELNDALARGLPGVRLTDRLAIVPDEATIDYRHFRLTGTRDYCLPPEKCVDVEADGVTLSVDLARSDLLLETEVQGLAELLARPAVPGRRLYRVTPASLAAARQAGWTLANLETWFLHRTGLPLSPAGQLLFLAPELPPLDLRRQIVLHTPTALAADGLQQWPTTRELIQARLGPTTVVVAEQNVDALRARCEELGLRLFQGEG